MKKKAELKAKEIQANYSALISKQREFFFGENINVYHLKNMIPNNHIGYQVPLPRVN